MANIITNTNILPTSANLSLGSSSANWNIYGNIYGNADSASKANLSTTTGNVFFAFDSCGTFAVDSDFIYDSTSNVLNVKLLNGYIIVGKTTSSTLGQCATAEGYLTIASGITSHAEGYLTNALGISAHAEGYLTSASSSNAHVEGYMSRAFNTYSHAEGYNTFASGLYAHAEGYETIATYSISHAEGYLTAAGVHYNAHAEGYGTTATGVASHAEGYLTLASHDYSHTEGMGTISSNTCSYVFGEYNLIESTTVTYLEIVGNGLSNNSRSNTRTLDIDGNEKIIGNVHAQGFMMKINDEYKNIIDIIYPVGAIYISTENINPGVLFGGTWEPIEDKFLACSHVDTIGVRLENAETHTHTTNSGTVGDTALSINQIPIHSHTLNSHSHPCTSDGYRHINYNYSVVNAGVSRSIAATSSSLPICPYVNSTNADFSGLNTSSESPYTDYQGGGGAHNHSLTSVGTDAQYTIPPYLAVYVWYRVL